MWLCAVSSRLAQKIVLKSPFLQRFWSTCQFKLYAQGQTFIVTFYIQALSQEMSVTIGTQVFGSYTVIELTTLSLCIILQFMFYFCSLKCITNLLFNKIICMKE